jgi:hypothetical protein
LIAFESDVAAINFHADDLVSLVGKPGKGVNVYSIALSILETLARDKPLFPNTEPIWNDARERDSMTRCVDVQSVEA